MSDVRKWEDLELDCLENVFGRLGIESLLLDVPFVCKSWHRASLNPSCWQHIDISVGVFLDENGSYTPFAHRLMDVYQVKNFSVGGFFCMMSPRGLDKFASLSLSRFIGKKDMRRLAEKCPQLKSLSLIWTISPGKSSILSKLIGKWKQLEELTLGIKDIQRRNFEEIAAQIALNCKDFNSLILHGFGGKFSKTYALAIAKHLPNVRKLSIKGPFVTQEELEIILGSCKHLEYLNVSVLSLNVLGSKYNGIYIWEGKKLKQLARSFEG